MPLIEGKSKKSFEKNVATEVEAGKDPKQAVAIAYAVKRRNMNLGGAMKQEPQSNLAKLAKGGAVSCAHGGPMHCNAGCYAEGGQVSNEKLHPHSEPAMDPRISRDISAMRAPGHNQSEIAKLAMGGSVVDQIMHERKKMARGGAVESERDYEPAFAEDVDLENVHYMEDDEHEIDSNPSDDDDSLIGQIMSERERKKKAIV